MKVGDYIIFIDPKEGRSIIIFFGKNTEISLNKNRREKQLNKIL